MSYKFKTAKEFNYEQVTPSTNWIIDFPFKGLPIIDVMTIIDGVLTKIMPASINRISDVQIEIIFDIPMTGKAHLVI
jgi:hypothetical protein